MNSYKNKITKYVFRDTYSETSDLKLHMYVIMQYIKIIFCLAEVDNFDMREWDEAGL